MQVMDDRVFGKERIARLLAGVPFYNEVARLGRDQSEMLVQQTGIYTAAAGETIIRAGDVDASLFFLLRGQLAVLAQGQDEDAVPVYYISPGEVFGTLSVLLGTPRSATIRVAESCQEVVLGKLDFTPFSEPQGGYSLPVRLAFFHMVVHHIRWTLEVKRMESPEHELVRELWKLPLIKAEKGSEEELDALQQQAQGLAELLCRWNEEGRESSGALQLT